MRKRAIEAVGALVTLQGLKSMRCSEYSRMCSESYAKLVQELAPDSVLRALFAPIQSDSVPTPELFRGLISTLLRSAEPNVVSRVLSALKMAAFSMRKSSNFAALLGFTITTTSDTRREVLYDIISSATKGRTLVASGPALKFYSNAGHGSLDAEEYEKPEREGLQDAYTFGMVRASVENLRLDAMASFVNFAAEAIRLFKDTVREEKILVGDSRVRTLLVDGVLKNGMKLRTGSRGALHLLFCAICTVESPKGCSDIVTHMVGAFAGSANRSRTALGLYLREIEPSKTVGQACLVYLKQRFGVKNVDYRKLSMKKFVSDVLDVKIQTKKNRPNYVVPAVCAGILKCLIEQADHVKPDDCGKMFEHDDLVLATMHSKGDELLRKCTPEEKDKEWFKDQLHQAQIFAPLISQQIENRTPRRR